MKTRTFCLSLIKMTTFFLGWVVSVNVLATDLVVQPGKKIPSYEIDGVSVSGEAALNMLNGKKVVGGDEIKVYLDDKLTFAEFETVSGLVGKAGFSKPEYYVFRKGAVQALQIDRVKVVPLKLAKKKSPE